MEIKSEILLLKNGGYQAIVDVRNFYKREQKVLDRHKGALMDAGGYMKTTKSKYSVTELKSNPVVIPRDFPLSQVFKNDDRPDMANLEAIAFIETMHKRIQKTIEHLLVMNPAVQEDDEQIFIEKDLCYA